MSKYNFDLDLETKNALSVIIGMIQPNSKVLEFGPAHGRMTRYLKEELGCSVDIVELDEEAGLEAAKYAERALVGADSGNIENYQWIDIFGDNQYDYIVFADVLEHLYNPQEVLRKSKELLKKDGSVLLSIPNIAHNDVLINLYFNRFRYTKIGLLDNTHIRFFALEELSNIFNLCDFKIDCIDTINADVGGTEQSIFLDDKQEKITELFMLREFGNVYQFILQAKNNFASVEQNLEEKIKKLREIKVPMTLYINKGRGFNEELKITRMVNVAQPIKEKFILEGGIVSLRFDPVEGVRCNVCICKIDSDASIDTIKPLNSTGKSGIGENYDEFLTLDSMYEIKGNFQNASFITFELDIVPIDVMTAIDRMVVQQSALQEQLDKAKNDIDLAYSVNFERLIQLNDLQEQLSKAKKEIGQKDFLLSQAQKDINLVYNSNCWRVTKPLRLITSAMRTIFKFDKKIAILYRKGVMCLKQHGFTYTINKIKHRNIHKKTKPQKAISIEELEVQRKKIFKDNVKFSILVPVYNTKNNLLREMIQSVRSQTYENWELCISNASDENHEYVQAVIENFSNIDNRIKCCKLDENKGIAGNTNMCAKMATGQFFAMLDHDDLLTPDALFEVASILEKADVDVIYSDEEKITEGGKRRTPFYKPDWSPDLLYTQMYICHFLVFKADLIEHVGLFSEELDGAQDYDFMLRLSAQTNKIQHIPRILYLWREVETSTSINPDAKPYANVAGKNAVTMHLKRKFGEYAHVDDTEYGFVYDARFDLLENTTKVSIIIPMKDQHELSDACIRSIVEKSSYSNYEILILNNQSEHENTTCWFREISKLDRRIKVIDADFDFNWAKLNNFGMQQASGDVFIFLNNDTKVISKDWIERLCENALRQDIGVVGALLLYADNTIQHAGVIVGYGGWAGHVFNGMYPVHYGSPYVSPMVNRNVLAVTGACMSISKNTINKIGKFNEEFIICGSDVEICIRAYEFGLNNLYNARVKLYHLESKSRDSYIPAIDFEKSYQCYKQYIELGDPFYNCNLDTNCLIPKRREFSHELE